jgi:hypothetical protein
MRSSAEKGVLMTDFKSQQREAAAIRADMQKAHKLVNEAKTRYIKTKLKAKNKKQTENVTLLFADLALFATKQEIQDFYGGGYITRTEYERLTNLWDEREHHTTESGKYHDRVIEMLEKAMSCIGNVYEDFLCEADEEARANQRNQQGKFPKEGEFT